MPDRAVIDTSSVVSPRHRRGLQRAAEAGACVAIWSPWIIAELNRVLVWRWIRQSDGDVSVANRSRCADAAKAMMEILLATFELVAPLPPYPTAWETLRDPWDHPIWAAAKTGGAAYVVSENCRDFPPSGPDGRHVFEGIEYLSAEAFLTLLVRGPGKPS